MTVARNLQHSRTPQNTNVCCLSITRRTVNDPVSIHFAAHNTIADNSCGMSSLLVSPRGEPESR